MNSGLCRITVLSLLSLGIPCLCSGTTRVSAQIADLSASGAPVKISGHVIFEEDQSRLLPYLVSTSISFKNVSDTPILLNVVRLRFVTAHIKVTYLEQDDYYFQEVMLQPGSSTYLSIKLPFGRSSAVYDARPIRPHADAKVVFVQFANGSKWGDSNVADRAINERKLALDSLESLSKISKNDSEQNFVRALMQPTELEPLLKLQELYHNSKDYSSVSLRMNEMLQSARVHFESFQP